MADNADISLLGFKGFTASERFLRALDDEIWVARQDPDTGLTDIVVHRPDGIDSGGAMRAELEQPSRVTVVSAHAGYWGKLLGFCGDGDQPVLKLDNQLGTLGATGMVLIDACYGPELAAELKTHTQADTVIAYLDYGPGKEQITRGKDSVTVIGSVIRELCYTVRPGLSPEAAARAVSIINAQSDCRKQVQRPRLRML
jgi:hypothetical protein